MSKYNNKTRGEPSKMAEMIKSAKQSAERDGVGLYQSVIDMVDDTLGYVPGNVHIICQLAYYIKHNPDYTSEEKEEVFAFIRKQNGIDGLSRADLLSRAGVKGFV